MAYCKISIVFTIFCLVRFACAQYQHEIDYNDASRLPTNDWFRIERALYSDDDNSPQYRSTSAKAQEDPESAVNIRTKRSYQTYPSYPTKNVYVKHDIVHEYQYPTKKLYHVKNCYAIARTATNDWCNDNCRQGYCPETHCVCSGLSHGSTKYVYTKKYVPTVYHKLPAYGNKYQTVYQTKTGYNNNYGDSNSDRFEQQTIDSE